MNLAQALQALRAGHVVGLPTDTVYGIGADPFREEAVASLFAAKGRPEVKPIPLLAADMDQVRRVAVLDDRTARRAGPHWPGALTLVLPRASGLPDWIGDAERDTVGVRVPDHPVALELLDAFGPLAVTSANPSGKSPAQDDEEARAALGDAIAVYVPGRGSGGAASTVIDLTAAEPRVLRPGPVEWEPT